MVPAVGWCHLFQCISYILLPEVSASILLRDSLVIPTGTDQRKWIWDKRCVAMRGGISKRSMDALLTPTAGETVLWDAKLPGFGVRIRPSGMKSYIVQYRAGKGRGAPLRKVVIGKHGSPWTPDTARIEAKRLLGLVAGGADPAAIKADRRDALTVTDLVGRFLSDHVEAKRKSRTAAEYRRLVNRVILPSLGTKKIEDVTRADVARLHHAGRGTPYQANRVLAVLSKMFNLAEAWGLRPDGSNPCVHVERNTESGRERLLSGAELARLGEALSAYDRSPFVPAAIKLLLFTGARLSEVLGMRWETIDFERGETRLADSKTGAKTLHLPAAGVGRAFWAPACRWQPLRNRWAKGWRGTSKS